jgi:hypothetical protein
MTNLVDWNFIHQSEGFSLSAYIPEDHGTPIGNSGVTLCYGVDLGQMSPQSLTGLGLSANLTNLLQPYAGLKALDAVAYLANNPLTISQEQSDELMNAVENQKFAEISVMYDKDTNGPNYEDLTSAQQTCIMDVFFQYYSLPQRTPKFWQSIINQNWSETITILRNFGDSYPSRRNAEADLLVSN